LYRTACACYCYVFRKIQKYIKPFYGTAQNKIQIEVRGDPSRYRKRQQETLKKKKTAKTPSREKSNCFNKKLKVFPCSVFARKCPADMKQWQKINATEKKQSARHV
jgi:hypothetical protein